MSTNRLTIDVSPHEVFAVLADAYSYERWVVGCEGVRAVEGDWPAVGSRFFHTVGVGPIKTKDNTAVLEVDAPHELVLEARARPAGVAKVTFRLVAVEGGTDVSIEEFPIKGIAMAIDNPLLDGLIRLRNVETLRRLEKQVSARKATPQP